MEISLKGGRTTPGVVRIDDTVCRPLGPHSEFVHQVLIYLESVKFKGVPRFLGMDTNRREILSFLEGDTVPDLGHFTDKQLNSAAKLIRSFHNATTHFPGLNKEVLCHHDLSPCNFVFRKGTPVGIFDFDTVKEGDRIEDVSYACWLWLNLGDEFYSPQEQGRRISLFLSAYGLSNRTTIFESILHEQSKRISDAQGNEKRKDFMKWVARCLAWMKANKKELLARLDMRDAQS